MAAKLVGQPDSHAVKARVETRLVKQYAGIQANVLGIDSAAVYCQKSAHIP